LLKAKSKPERSLLRHTLDVVTMARRYATRWPHLLELARNDGLFDDLILAALLHDLGKAASGFQSILNGEDDSSWQGYRHEILSGAVVATLSGSSRRQDILLAVMTHHICLNDDLDARRSLVRYDPANDTLTTFDERLSQLRERWEELSRLVETLKTHAPADAEWPVLPDDPLDLPDPFGALRESVRRGRRSRGRGDRPLPLGRIFLRGLLVGSDHLASAAVTEENARKDDIVAELPVLKIIEPSSFPFELNQHQEACATTKGSVFLDAPTGSGKTEAALLWTQINQSPQQSRHVFYVLPFTASINAMYGRLKGDSLFGDDAVSFLHGRSAYFAYRWLCEDKTDAHPKEAAGKAREARRLTRELYHPVKVLTPHQILMAFLGTKGWEKSLCEYAGGIFILDEIHAYEPRLTGLLFEILRRLTQELGACVCVMSATFPTPLQNALVEHVGEAARVSLDDAERDRYSRHLVRVEEGTIVDRLPEIREKLAAGKRVLVVLNTVAGAMACFEELREAAKNPCLVHGRLIQRDRQAAEDRLEGKNNPVDLLVGTQAIEVSLDIDFDLLYTDPAPLDALLQRFGRVNRKPLHELERLAQEVRFRDVVICSSQWPETPPIYDERLVARTLIDTVYDGEQLAVFLEIANAKSEQLRRTISSLEPGNEKPYGEEELLDELIDSIPIVPARFYDGHQDRLRNKRFFDAQDYVFNISKRRYYALKKGGKLYKAPVEERQYLYGLFSYEIGSGPNFDVHEPLPTSFL
jgi:CRISPR-associated endonuclease/helicase Cas3